MQSLLLLGCLNIRGQVRTDNLKGKHECIQTYFWMLEIVKRGFILPSSTMMVRQTLFSFESQKMSEFGYAS